MAETEILKAGSWQERRLQADGAVVLEVLTAVRGTALAVDGLQGSLRHHSPTSGAFPLKAATEGVMIVASAPEGTAFPGGAIADLSLTFPSTGQAYLLQGIDISGHGRAPLAELTWDQDRWKLLPAVASARAVREARSTEPPVSSMPRSTGMSGDATGARSGAGRSSGRSAGAGPVPAPAADAPRAEILGSWIARRLAESDRLCTPAVAAILIDDSASMRAHHERLSELTALIRAFISAAGAREPEIRSLAVGGAGREGVGSAALSVPPTPAGADAEGRVQVVVTDLPGRAGSLPTLVIGDPDIADALLDSDSALVLTPEAWHEIEREDTDYDDATLRHLAPLTQWLEDPLRTKENA